jgi:hypothetical protein
MSYPNGYLNPTLSHEQQNNEINEKVEVEQQKERRGTYKKLPVDAIINYEKQTAELLSKNPESLSEAEKILLGEIDTINKRANEYRIAIAKAKAEAEAEAQAKASTSNGGNKKKDTYTVKELKTIASRNNIKTTKKLNGKTVPLNKKGLVAKLKRNKVI